LVSIWFCQAMLLYTKPDAACIPFSLSLPQKKKVCLSEYW
jgi:hypothetical protein